MPPLPQQTNTQWQPNPSSGVNVVTYNSSSVTYNQSTVTYDGVSSVAPVTPSDATVPVNESKPTQWTPSA